MLRLLNDKNVEVDESELYEPPQTCGLILVTGITGSRFNLIAEAIACAAPYAVNWSDYTRARKAGVKVGDAAERDPTTFFVGELNALNDDHGEMITTMQQLLKHGHQVVASVHANPVRSTGGLRLEGLITRLGLDVLDDRRLSGRKTHLIDLMLERRAVLVGVWRGAGVSVHVHTSTLAEFVEGSLARPG